MARASRELHSTDFVNDEDEGVLDFATLRFGEGSISVVSEREFKDSQELESFMDEPLIIMVHESTDRNAPTHAYCAVQGVGGFIPRGKKVRLARKFVERLALSQAISYKTRQNSDMNADDAMDTRRTVAQDYPFSVLRDPNPKGAAWLRRVTFQGR